MSDAENTTENTTEPAPEAAHRTTEGASFADAAAAATPAPEGPSKGLTVAEVIAGPAPDERVGLPDHSTDAAPEPAAEPAPEPTPEPDAATDQGA